MVSLSFFSPLGAVVDSVGRNYLLVRHNATIGAVVVVGGWRLSLVVPLEVWDCQVVPLKIARSRARHVGSIRTDTRSERTCFQKILYFDNLRNIL